MPTPPTNRRSVARPLVWAAAGSVLTGAPLLIALIVVAARPANAPVPLRAYVTGPRARTTTTPSADRDEKGQGFDSTNALIPPQSRTPTQLQLPPEAENAPVTRPVAMGPVVPPVVTPEDESNAAKTTTAPTGAVNTRLPASTRRALRPPLFPTSPAVVGGISDADIEASIRKGIEYYLSQWDPRKGISKQDARENAGPYSLVIYALIQSGLAVGDARLGPRGEYGNAALNALRELPLPQRTQTYAVGLRAACLSVFNRREDRERLQEDVALLLACHQHGGYTYQASLPPSDPGLAAEFTPDNSNSQYGLLGVLSGAETGIEVPTQYWKDVQDHWDDDQKPDGRWTYSIDDPYPSQTMTAAGIASLFATRDYLAAGTDDAPVGRPPFSLELQRGLDWWETGDNGITVTWSDVRYDFRAYGHFGIARVGLASGYKYFGKNDWYRVVAKQIIAQQNPNGGWTDQVKTAFELLFLARGRHPIVMNKLRFDGSWANRPRDVANLTRHVSQALERPLNWQVVDLNHEWWDWLDSPILYIASHQPPKFTDDDYQKFRKYVQAGGLIYTQADAGAKDFNDFIPLFGKKVFPEYEFKDVPDNHELYSLVSKVKERPKLRAISNGSRILILHSPADISRWWQVQDSSKPDLSNFGVNLFAYANGTRDLRNRLNSLYVPPPTLRAPFGPVRIARLQHSGDWDPEPGGWRRFTSLFQYRTGTALNVANLKCSDLRPGSAPLVHLTGAAAYPPVDAELDALKNYVEAGGVVLIDSCGGSGAFTMSVQDALMNRFPDLKFQPLMPSHPLLSAGPPGMADLGKPDVRPFAAARGLKNLLPQVVSLGKGHVIFSRLDITSGLLGTSTSGISGYTTKYAEAFMQNLILWTMDGQPDAWPATRVQPARTRS